MPAISTSLLLLATDGHAKATFTPALAPEQYTIVAHLVTDFGPRQEVFEKLAGVADKWSVKLECEITE